MRQSFSSGYFLFTFSLYFETAKIGFFKKRKKKKPKKLTVGMRRQDFHVLETAIPRTWKDKSKHMECCFAQ
jgi:hypothetical protein